MSSNGQKIDTTIRSKKVFLVSPEHISCRHPWIVWPKEPSTDFIQQIKKFGQQTPVLVIKKNKRYHLVHGYKRVQAALQLNQPIWCLEIEPLPIKKLILLYVSLNAHQLNTPWAKIKALRILTPFGWEKEDLELLQINIKGPQQEYFQTWLRLPAYWDELLENEHLCLESSTYLAKLKQPELEYLFPFFKLLKWSKSNQHKLLTWLTELKLQQHIALEQLEQDLGLIAILKSNLSPQDKIKNILHTVWNKRFPTMAVKKTQLDQHLKNISNGTLWHIEHKQHLENTALFFQAHLNGQKTLEQAITELRLIAKQNPWKIWHDLLTV
ncbi:MAG: ParB/RepB/Spo0J family partition protein [Desulfonauticus sp.]|nr:ParB/RepB/Spo0J family partition protein [Desulfonauticus sp.]